MRQKSGAPSTSSERIVKDGRLGDEYTLASGIHIDHPELTVHEIAEVVSESVIDEDTCGSEDEAGAQWGADYEEQEATTRVCQGMISGVRYVARQKPIESLRVLGGTIWRG